MKIGITMGDPSGIGPEVILKALGEPLAEGVEPVVFGSREVFERTDRLLVKAVSGYQSIRERFETLEGVDEPVEPAAIGMVEVLDELSCSDIPFGEPDARSAQLQLAAFHSAVTASQQDHIGAIVTAPWTKELFRTLEMPPIGHTKILAEAFDVDDQVMMLAGPRLRVALVTTHVPLAEVSGQVTAERLEAVIRTTGADLGRLYGIDHPKLGVCGLNPHAGEKGVMGAEEVDVIGPVVSELADELADQIELSGPFPSDTLFARYRRDRHPFDAVICMYHDQGLIPLKLMHFGESANVTLGLPVVRTSVDHGTAYDIAGWGVADPGSMRYALELAVDMARRLDS